MIGMFGMGYVNFLGVGCLVVGVLFFMRFL